VEGVGKRKERGVEREKGKGEGPRGVLDLPLMVTLLYMRQTLGAMTQSGGRKHRTCTTAINRSHALELCGVINDAL